MSFKYVPILRSRRAEKNALMNQQFSEKILPLIEIVKEKEAKNSKKTFSETYEGLFRSTNSPLLVDIPMYLKLPAKTDVEVQNFLRPIYIDQMKRIIYLNALASLKGLHLIPVISYRPFDAYVNNIIKLQAKALKPNFNSLCFRLVIADLNDSIQLTNLRKALIEIEALITKDDILMLDIFENACDNINIMPIYKLVLDVKNKTGCYTVIANSPLHCSITNTGLVDGITIPSIDNKLIRNYRLYGFDAFGDSAGIKRDEIIKIPITSPAYIHYNKKNNNYIGFKGIFKVTSSFSTMVLPKYTQSSFWLHTPIDHKTHCYGCSLVDGMLLNPNIIKPNSATRWKSISVSHYIRCMDELL